MGFNIVRYEHADGGAWGVVKGEAVMPFAPGVEHLGVLFDEGHIDTARGIARDDSPGTVALAEINLRSPVTRPVRLLAMGVNYRDHRAEAGGNPEDERLLFFRKDDSSINSANGDIVCPAGEPLLDYEVEMGLVLKRPITGPTTITRGNLGTYVGGVVLVNDVSGRLTMVAAPWGQWYRGKSGRTMCPMGPYVHIFDDGEAEKVHNMEIRLWVNGDLRQDAHTRDLITPPEAALTEASQFVDLAAGDVLLTGTPGGVAVQAPPKIVLTLSDLIPSKLRMKLLVDGQLKSGKFLQEGDVVRCTLRSDDGTIDCGEQRSTIVGAR